MTRTPQPQPTPEEIAEQIVENWMANWDQDDDPLKQAILEALRNERNRCERLAINPYGDEVEALGSDEPKTVGEKIAKAIREGR